MDNIVCHWGGVLQWASTCLLEPKSLESAHLTYFGISWLVLTGQSISEVKNATMVNT